MEHAQDTTLPPPSDVIASFQSEHDVRCAELAKMILAGPSVAAATEAATDVGGGIWTPTRDAMVREVVRAVAAWIREHGPDWWDWLIGK